MSNTNITEADFDAFVEDLKVPEFILRSVTKYCEHCGIVKDKSEYTIKGFKVGMCRECAKDYFRN